MNFNLNVPFIYGFLSFKLYGIMREISLSHCLLSVIDKNDNIDTNKPQR